MMKKDLRRWFSCGQKNREHREIQTNCRRRRTRKTSGSICPRLMRRYTYVSKHYGDRKISVRGSKKAARCAASFIASYDMAVQRNDKDMEVQLLAAIKLWAQAFFEATTNRHRQLRSSNRRKNILGKTDNKFVNSLKKKKYFKPKQVRSLSGGRFIKNLQENQKRQNMRNVLEVNDHSKNKANVPFNLPRTSLSTRPCPEPWCQRRR